jgi:hypothetical protein
MDEKQTLLTPEDERTLADLHGSNYFAALVRLAEALDRGAMVPLKNKSTSDVDVRYWQGYAGGVAATVLTIKSIAQRNSTQE